jgi:hypothetical protein
MGLLVENYAVTPFGVLEDDAGAYKSFDEDSFWDEVLSPSEKERLKKNKEGFLADPDSFDSEPVSASLKFHPWKKPVIASAGRTGTALQLLVSNTWSLNKDAIPDFLRLLEKLRDKYMDVLGDSELMSLLEEAEHRAHELQVSNEAGEEVKSSAVFSHGGSGMCTGTYPLSIGVTQDSDGDEIDPYEMYFEDELGSFSKVDDRKKRRGRFSSAGGKVVSGVSDPGELSPEEERAVGHILQEKDKESALYSKVYDFIDTNLTNENREFRRLDKWGWLRLLQDKFGVDDFDFEENFNPYIIQVTRKLREERKRQSLGGGSVTSSASRIVSAQDGVVVDQQAYDQFVQQLIAKGVPEDQARQSADNMVEQLRQDMQNFAGSMVSGDENNPNQSGVVSSRRGEMGNRFITSDGDVIVHQDDDDEKGGESGDDLGLEGLGGVALDEGSAEDDQPLQLEDGFMDEVNSIDEFGANEPQMSNEEVVDALRAIDQIVNTVLEVEGAGDDPALTSDEEGFVLDQVDDLAASFGGEGEGAGGVDPGADVEAEDFDFGGGEGSGEVDAAEDEELDSLENIGAGLVRVVVAGEPVRHPAFSSVYVTEEKFGGSDAIICSGLNLGSSLVLDGDADDSILDTLVCSSMHDIKKDTPVKTGYLKASAFKRWVSQSRRHRLSWRAAVHQATRRLGHKPQTLPEMASALAIASSIYDKWFGGKAIPARKVFAALAGRKTSQLRRVNAALQKRSFEGKSTQVIRSDYNGYSNYATWNAALFLKQDAKFRDQAKAFLKSNRGASYDQLIQGLGLAGSKTPDNVPWLDRRISREEMGDVLSFLSNSYRGDGMSGAVRSATQVDGSKDVVITVQEDTPTGVSESGKTLSSGEIEGENSTRLTNVDGGDTSAIVDVNNTGDDGSLEADIDAGTEFNDSGYSFDSSKIAAIELPIEGEDATQVLEVREIGSGVYMLQQAYVAPGAGRCSFTKGKEAKAIISRRTKPVQKIKANVDRVLALKGSQNALLLRSSSVLGVVGVEAPFSKGLKNSKYSVFSRTGVNLVNEDGYYISLPKGPQRIIASAVSNKAVRQGKEKHNIVASLEQEYIKYLRSCVAKAFNDNRLLRQRLDQALKVQERRRTVQSRVLDREHRAHVKEIASSYADLQSLRVKSGVEDTARVFGASQDAIRGEQAAIKSQAERNIEYLVSLM